MTKLEYRPDIDGLRSFAVLAVVLFHLDIPFLSAGFIGVDIFFVISGFLITRLIKHELEVSASLSYSEFYLRRARRLLPSLFFTIFVSLVCAVILLSPDHLARFGAAALHASLSLSNFYFWQEAGYFDVAATMKPLLHTWSLSIEEQFYIIWPFALSSLILLKRNWITVPTILCILFLSLFLNHIFADGESSILRSNAPIIADIFNDGPSTLFYLLPFRMYEFLIGALLVWLNEYRCKINTLEEFFLFLGFCLVGMSFVFFNENTVWPGLSALLPCIGTALIIFSGRAKFFGLFLSNRLAVNIGQISYSLYLIHWPIIVFYKHIILRPLSHIEQFGLLTLSLICATLMYRFIEQPFRLRKQSKNRLSASSFGLVSALIILGIILPSSNMWATNGWVWRKAELHSQADLERSDTARWKHILNACTLRMFAGVHNSDQKRSDGKPKCKKNAQIQITVLGDSHTVDGYNTFQTMFANDPNTNVIYSLKDGGADGCGFRVDKTNDKFIGVQRADCPERIEVFNSDVWSDIDIIVLDVFKNHERHYHNIRYLADRYPHLKIIVLGTFVGTRPHHCRELANRFKTFDACFSPEFVTTFGTGTEFWDTLPTERSIYIDRIAMFCGSHKRLEDCETTLPNGTPFFIDGDHLTLEASEEIAKRLLQATDPILKKIGL